MWSISVPPGLSILLEFDHFDVENDSHCRHDRLTVSVGTHRPVGELQTRSAVFICINIHQRQQSHPTLETCQLTGFKGIVLKM